MPNMMDYMEWRGDLSFSADPFNDVDNLILAYLAYTEFEGIVPDDGTQIPINKVREKFFSLNPHSEIEHSDDILERTALLMDGMITGDRFGTAHMAYHVDIVKSDEDIQMSAVTYILSDGSAYIAFRGTDNTVVGWKEDFKMSYLPETGGQRAAIDYLNRIGSEIDGPLRVGGHSKGGNFAIYASAFCRRDIQDRIMQVYNNDGPGFRNEVMEKDEYRRILPRVKSIVPESSVIGMLLGSGKEPLIVDSSAKYLLQHDAMTWQIRRNGFAAATHSEFGRFVRATQKDWLSKLDDETREQIVDSVFSLISATGADTFEEMKDKKLKSLERIISSVQGMSRARQKELLRVAGELIQSGRDIALGKKEISNSKSDDRSDVLE